MEDFLEYARLRPLQPRNVPLNKIIEDLARMVRSRDDLDESARLETVLPQVFLEILHGVRVGVHPLVDLRLAVAAGKLLLVFVQGGVC